MNHLLSKNLFWPATEWLCGRDTGRRLRELHAADGLSLDALRALQTRKLRHLLRHAATQCPLYASHFALAGVDPADPELSLADLERIPSISREQIRDHREEMIAADDHRRLIPYSTGGSTGEPLQLYIDADRAAADWAARWRARAWWGLRPGDTEVLLWGGPARRTWKDTLKTWRDATLNQHVFSAFELSPHTMHDYLEQIKALQPSCVYGYASSLALLARFALEEGCGDLRLYSTRLRAVFTTGEVLTRHDQDAIAAAFGAPVAQEYGCRDGGLLGCACPQGSLHVPQENVIVELLDECDRPVKPGEPGDVVITYLETFAMPIIRYRNGDVAVMAQEPCSCGRASMVLKEVQGRRSDHIVCWRGDELIRMHALSLIYVIREVEGVRQFQIHQPSLDRLEVNVVPDHTFTADAEHRIISGLQQRMGERVQIELRRREHIPALASGKYVCVTSDLRDEVTSRGLTLKHQDNLHCSEEPRFECIR